MKTISYCIPRSANVNYMDLWMDQNNPTGSTSNLQATKWEKHYFGVNFDKFALVKSIADFLNFLS